MGTRVIITCRKPKSMGVKLIALLKAQAQFGRNGLKC
jgi:hypothetical protein